MDKPLAFTILGATGFTGRQVVRHLTQKCAAELGAWAIAGRSRVKLEALAAQLPTSISIPRIVVADTSNRQSINSILSQTRVLANLAGPYAPHGDALVADCIRHHTDYVDLSGETPFSQALIKLHHPSARSAGVKIIPSCGYEALPFDLCVLMCVQTLQTKHQQACKQVSVVNTTSNFVPHRFADVLSGGTVNTIKAALALDDVSSMSDPAALVTHMDLAEGIRKRNPYKLAARYDAAAGSWTLPLLPIPFVNPPVIHRSAQLWAEHAAGYGEGFTYYEGLHLFDTDVNNTPRTAIARLAGAVVGGAMHLMESKNNSPGRKVALRALEAFAPVSGDGPSHEALEHTCWRLTAYGQGEGGAQVQVHFVAQGHPGYRSTANFLAEATLALAYRRDELPAIHGIVTPATALGRGLDSVLQRAGVTLSIS